MEAVEGLRDSLWDLYRRVTDARQHEIAYHSLAALVHAGERLKDAGLLDDIEAAARARIKADAVQQKRRP